MINVVAFQQHHLDKTYQWMLDENLKKNFLFRGSVTPESHLHWFEQYLIDQSQKIYAVCFDDLHVGNIGLKNIDTTNRNAETWVYIGDATMKGKGVGKVAYQQLLSLWKEGFHKIYANIAEFNTSSIKMYQKAGFSLEGIFKNQLLWDNQYYSILRFAIFL
ncbi:MAG: GNAT family N-acetyltransferase [Opitutaceae bacterium]|nr:GNAT family N-acetyltransferase [Cytophagales bacterium]